PRSASIFARSAVTQSMTADPITGPFGPSGPVGPHPDPAISAPTSDTEVIVVTTGFFVFEIRSRSASHPPEATNAAPSAFSNSDSDRSASMRIAVPTYSSAAIVKPSTYPPTMVLNHSTHRPSTERRSQTTNIAPTPTAAVP